ncbi:MAG: DUF4159 domain-containing protein [Pseudomonadota bacterium]
MWVLGPIGFTAPWLLLALAALPILWILLRAVPPAPIRRRFPGVALLLGLQEDEQQTDRTPWWLLLLRMLAVAAAIIGFAGPVLNPDREASGTGPLLIVFDGGWADAPTWPARMDRAEAALADAARDGRPAAVAVLTDLDAAPPAFQAAQSWTTRLPGITPAPWLPDAGAHETLAQQVADLGGFDTLWMSDGLDRPGRGDLLTALQAQGAVSVYQAARPQVVLHPVRFEDGNIIVSGSRLPAVQEVEVTVHAIGRDPTGIERILATVPLTFEGAEPQAEVSLALPPELRNRVTRMSIAGVRSAGAVTLTDDGLKRREVALIAGGNDREGLELLSPVHYLEQALIPTADLIGGDMSDILLANPDVIVLADVAQVSDEADVLDWVDQGGLLVRFAGTRLAASDLGREIEDPLLPVRLRVGGRSVGGAMSWGDPKTLQPFSADSPFFGLPIPEDVTVAAQVMAEPDPMLAERTIASLADGTPLVTRKRVGEGQVILFHVTANAEWSTLPLSGLFVGMLERLAISTRPAVPDLAELEGTVWQPMQQLTGFGDIEPADGAVGVAGAVLGTLTASPDLPAGLYSGQDRSVAVNAVRTDFELAPAVWPAGVPVAGGTAARDLPLKGWVLAAGLTLLMVDLLASLWLSGKLRGPRAQVAALVLGAMMVVPQADAQMPEDALALRATTEVVLAHVVTGDRTLDQVAAAGLRGLGDTLFRRTAIEPADPIAVDIETDEIAFFPFIYWPVTPTQAVPSAEAYAKLNRYLRGGGMILFDTRDGDTAQFGASSPAARKLQQIARPLDIPPLEPIPQDHVLTRAFYLLQDFPGRYNGAAVWVEAAPPDAEQVEGMPFRNLNDGVTPVVVGANDWASAWAQDARGNWLYPVGRGFQGERQREIALRFGVNLIMHVLTGNYKSDQVHVPALLDRLGQ